MVNTPVSNEVERCYEGTGLLWGKRENNSRCGQRQLTRFNSEPRAWNQYSVFRRSMALIGINDSFDQSVSYHINLFEIHEFNISDILEDGLGFH